MIELDVEEGKSYKVMGYACGWNASSKLKKLGITVGRVIKIKTFQPFEGPVTIEVNRSNYSLGRGLFNKLLLEECQN